MTSFQEILKNFKPAKLPAHTRREIYWDEEHGVGHAFILIGYCPDTLPYHLAMLEDAYASYPEIDLDQVTFGKVSNSSTVKGFTLLYFRIPGQQRKIPRFENWNRGAMDIGF
jgi:hypothetical protein